MWLKSGLIALGAVLVVAIAFGAGFILGHASASPSTPPQNPARLGNRAGHGAIGTIEAIENQRITIRTRGGKSQILLIDDETRLERFFQNATLAEFKVKDQVVAIGSPNSAGEIKARLVGVVDPSLRPPRGFPGSTDSK
jgi:hypothetical protein